MTKKKEEVIIDMSTEELEQERYERLMKYEDLKNRINRYYNNVSRDYDFYKRVYIDHISQNKLNTKLQCKYELAKKNIDDLKYYFKDYIDESSEHTDTEEVNIDESEL